MDDLISRQAAIDEVREHRALHCDNTPEGFSKLPYEEKCMADEIDAMWATLVNLLTAEPNDEAAYEAGYTKAQMELKDAYKPRKGKWKRVAFVTPKGYRDTWCCDQCGDSVGTIRRNYCPNCGAKMMEESDED